MKTDTNNNPLENSGAESALTFITKTHNDVHPSIDPSKVTLPKPFVVAIIGASRGIGAGIAQAYAQAGASGLVLASRRTSGLEETAADVKKLNSSIEIEIVSCDITSNDSVQNLAAKTKSRFNRLDVLVINSGATPPVGPSLLDLSSDDWINTTNVNYLGTALSVKHLTPLLLATKHGAKAIIGVNSAATFFVRGPVANPPYSISKAAQFRLLEMAHHAYNPSEGLVTYSVHPGGVLTELAKDAAPEEWYGLLQDSTALCGAFAVWLTKDREREWLSGRYVAATWDTEELESRKNEVVKRDLLKLTLDV